MIDIRLSSHGSARWMKYELFFYLLVGYVFFEND